MCGATNICTVAKSKDDCLNCKGVTFTYGSNLYELIQDLLKEENGKKN